MLDAMEVPSHARHLLLQLNTQRTKGFLCDVIIVVQNALFRAHKNILAASSLYLKSLVVHDNLINLDHEMVSPAVFRVILDYIYTGRLTEPDPASPTEPNIGAVLAAANYLQLLDLVALCKKKLKRNGKYSSSHPGPGFLPYKLTASDVGLGGRGRYRVTTPVIQPCFPIGNSHTPRPPSLDDLPPHPVPRHSHGGELYAPIGAQGPQAFPGLQQGLPPGQPGLRLPPPDRNCSPIYGLDLSKKSPGSQSQHTPSHLSHGHHPEDGELMGGRDGPQSGRDSSPLRPTSNHSDKMETNDHPGQPLTPHSLPRLNQPLVPHLPHLQRPGPQTNQEPYPCPPSPDTPGDNGDRRGRDRTGSIYPWVKNEPYNAEDEEEDEEDEEGDDRDKDGHHHHHQHLNDHRGGDCDGEDEKSGSGSEETGSSEGRPSPPGALGRYHMPFEPESFGDNLYVCIPCDKGFPSSEQLNAHVESHTEEDLFNSSEMGNGNGKGGTPSGTPNGPAGLNSNNSLSYLEGKNGQVLPAAVGLGEMIRPYRCSSCEKSYKDPATLRQHEKTHWLTRPYPCSICGKKFTQRGTMTRHMRSHLGLKPFACDACGMRFTRQYRLTEHMRIHSGEKPYECQVCGGKFAQQRNLISHMKMHSTGGASLTPDGKLKMDFGDGIYPLTKYTAEHLGLKQEKAELLAQASQHLLDAKTMESLYPLHKLSEHLGLAAAAGIHEKMEALNQALPPPPPPPPIPGETRTIDRYSPS